MHDQLGNYNAALLMVSALGLIGAAAIATLPRRAPARVVAAAGATA
jgi:hypothetical protein